MRAARAVAAAFDDRTTISFVRAPGRVNLIGDHTDYNDGLVLPLAIDRECVIGWSVRGDALVRVRSLDLDGAVTVAAAGSDDPGIEPAWGRLVAGVVGALTRRGRHAVGFDAALTSTVPLGAGLSSSAAFEVAIALAAMAATSEPTLLDRRELALACQEAEQLATGVPCGVMDQLASLFGIRDHALLIDCRSLAIEPVELPATLAVLVVHSGVERALAGSAYAERRSACERAASRLGVAALRDATLADVGDDPRARHVVSENQRVQEAAEALRAGDVDRLGALLRASHASLRDDFEVSTPELDLLTDLLVEEGAIGARLTGAGFGGSVVAIVRRNRADHVAARSVQRYRAATGLEPTAFVTRAVDGAGSLEVDA